MQPNVVMWNIRWPCLQTPVSLTMALFLWEILLFPSLLFFALASPSFLLSFSFFFAFSACLFSLSFLALAWLLSSANFSISLLSLHIFSLLLFLSSIFFLFLPLSIFFFTQLLLFFCTLQYLYTCGFWLTPGSWNRYSPCLSLLIWMDCEWSSWKALKDSFDLKLFAYFLVTASSFSIFQDFCNSDSWSSQAEEGALQIWSQAFLMFCTKDFTWSSKLRSYLWTVIACSSVLQRTFCCLATNYW